MKFLKLFSTFLVIILLQLEAQTIHSKNYGNQENYFRVLFENLFFVNSFSYTLFGEKPISFQICCRNEISSLNTQEYCNEILQRRPYGCHAKAWLSWKQTYEINTNKFLLIDEVDEDYVTIILINKTAFKKMINKNRKEFAKEFGENFTADNILKKIIDEKSLMKVLNENEELLGILCGYGARNSKLYFERSKLITDFEHCVTNLKSLSFINSLNKKIEKYNKTFSSSSILRNPPYYFLSIGFCVDKNTAETKILQKNIEKTQKKIAQAYLGKDFYQIIMAKLQCTKIP